MAATAPLFPSAEEVITTEVREGVALKVPATEINATEIQTLNADKASKLDQKAGLSKAQGLDQQHRREPPGDNTLATKTSSDGSKDHANHFSAQAHVANQADETSSSSDDDNDDEEDVWENSSLIEATFEQLEESHGPNPSSQSTPDECTLDEGIAYRRLLRQVGVEEFIRQTLEAETISAKKLCTAFGLRVPFLEGRPDEAYYRILGLAIQREIQRRIKLEQWNTIDDAVHLLKEAKNIIVVTGAGISTSLGIPDFRSKHNGLYSRLEHLGLGDPQEVFDIELFQEDPTVFYSVAKDILPETKKFTPTHAFIKMLQDRGKLLVNYTQNIDNIEGHAGIDARKLIQCHGSFATATCQKCGLKVNGDEIHDEIKAGKIPRCNACTYKSQQLKSVALKRKRSSDHRSRSRQRDVEDISSEEEFGEETGVMKPDITFFGEKLPDTFHDRLKDTDYTAVDLVIVIGTSLKVAPVAEIPNFVSGQNESIPQIYISRDPCEHIAFDIELLGECDVVIAELCRRSGWTLTHEMAVPPEMEIEVSNAAKVWQWNVTVGDDKGVQ